MTTVVFGYVDGSDSRVVLEFFKVEVVVLTHSTICCSDYFEDCFEAEVDRCCLLLCFIVFHVVKVDYSRFGFIDSF